MEMMDNNAYDFQSVLVSYNLQQHVSVKTRRDGHILGLVIK